MQLNEKQLHQTFRENFEKIKPSIDSMTNILMNVYEQGFKDCWKLLTGTNF